LSERQGKQAVRVNNVPRDQFDALVEGAANVTGVRSHDHQQLRTARASAALGFNVVEEAVRRDGFPALAASRSSRMRRSP